MSTPRETVAAQIEADHPDWQVHAYAHRPANVELGRPVVAVWRGKVEPGAKVQVLDHSVTVQAFGARTVGVEAEEEMDDLLDGVLLSLERLHGFTVQSAERASFYNDSLSGWQIEASMTSPNVYRDIVMRERQDNA